MKSPFIGLLAIVAVFNFSELFGQPLAPKADSSQAIADRIVKSEIPVLVDFWASWCMPCRMLNPIIEELEKEYKNRVLFIKVNVDVHRALSAYFKVTSIPAVFIIHKKSVVQAFPGVQPKERYIAALDTMLKTPSPDDTVPSNQQ